MINIKTVFALTLAGFMVVTAAAKAAPAKDSGTEKKAVAVPVVTEKEDSTKKFKALNESNPNAPGASGDIFEMPEIVLPGAGIDTSTAKKPVAAAGKGSAGAADASASAGAASAAGQTEDITLPIPIINLGISKNLIPDGGIGAKMPVVQMPVAAPATPAAAEMPVINQVDASKFDVAGIMLGMNAEDVMNTAKNNGFVVDDVVYTVPTFLEWRYKDVCQDQGVFVYEKRKECIEQMAAENNQRYISEIVVAKPELKEKIRVFFTSNFANNLAYRIEYNVAGNYALGTSAEPIFKKRQRRKDFWGRVFTKYGMPSDLSEMIWTEGFDKASLKVYMNMSTIAAKLVLEDVSITDADTYQMFIVNQYMPASDYFSF